MRRLLVVGNPANWTLDLPGVEVIAARAYLTDPRFARTRNVRVFNLSREYRYQSKGYYVSLLAEARGHKVIPSIRTIQDLKSPAVARLLSIEVDDLIQRSLRRIRSDEFVLSVYFGRNLAEGHDPLARELYRLFQAPLIRARFSRGKGGRWTLAGIRPIPVSEIPPEHMDFVRGAAVAYFTRTRHGPGRTPEETAYDLAILVDPSEKVPPSNRRAVQLFVEAGERAGFGVDVISREDAGQIGEYDALFIRETTQVNHPTYRLARRAESEGLAVIDDPASIVRCTNKVFLAELLQTHRIPAPRTMIVHSENRGLVGGELGFPCVLKSPDSSFSMGVRKVGSADELDRVLDDMFRSSDLVVAQEFVPTPFDWRIGVLEGEALYACKYYMARGHWQIYNWEGPRSQQEGAWETLPVEDVPAPVLETALKAARLMGNGLYGVDLKEVEGNALVVEVNDNPSVDHGVEDGVLGNELYDRIMAVLMRRVRGRAEGPR